MTGTRGAADEQALRQNQNGQLLGRKGRETRQRIIDAVIDQLQTKPLRELRVADIARAAHIRHSNFYIYFNDLSDVLVAATSHVPQSTPELLALVAADWSSAAAYGSAKALVEYYVRFWSDHGALFRARNLADEEGDLEVRQRRREAIRPLLTAMAERIAHATADDEAMRERLAPMATAGVLVAMLERLAMVTPAQNGTDGITAERSISAAAEIVARTMMTRSADRAR